MTTPAISDPHARANLALSLLQQREHTEHTLELAVMALRGADLEQLTAADMEPGCRDG